MSQPGGQAPVGRTPAGRPPMGSTLRWLMVFAAAVAAVLLGSGPARARTVSSASPNETSCTNFFACLKPTTTTQYVAPPPPPPASDSTTTSTVPATTTTTVPATTTTTTAGSATVAAFLPCGSTGACSEPPKQVEVNYAVGQVPSTVDVEWVKGSASSAPQPTSSSVTLDPTKAVTCSGAKPPAEEQAVCWPWPSGLTHDSWILNGTYQVTPEGAKPVTIGLAVPPAPPRQVVATATTDSVAISWQPSASPEPDLVGYAVTRNGQAVYECSVDAMGPGAHTACAHPLGVTDHPGPGKWSYSVSAMRLGVDDASGDTVGSAPVAAAPGAITLTAAVTGASSAAPLPSSGLAPLPPSVGATYAPPSSGPASSADPAAIEGVAPETAPVPNLKYPDNPVVGKSSQLAVNIGEPGSHPDVVPVAVLALGIIALAIAAHFLYLRVELSLVETRLAERRRRRTGN